MYDFIELDEFKKGVSTIPCEERKEHLKELVERKWLKLKLESSFAQKAVDLLDYLSIRSFDLLDDYLDKKVLYKKKDDANLTKIYLWIKRCDSLINGKEIN